MISSWEIQPCKTQRPGACFAAHTPQSPDQSASKKKGVQVIPPELLFSSDSYTSTPGTGRRVRKPAE